MIVKDNTGLEYLEDLKAGRIKLGLGIDSLLDDHLRFKRGQLVMINGHDNVGKTYWICYYFLCLCVKHGLTFTIYSSENQIANIKRDLIQFKTGKKLAELDDATFYREFNEISHYFKFVDIEQLYTAESLLKVFQESDTDAYLIDPLTTLLNGKISVNKHETDNETILHLKTWIKQNKKVLYINTHCSTESTRKVYPKDHDLAGHIMPPNKADTIGGQKYADRADDFITIHRLVQHEHQWMNTQVHVRKVKDTQTGGKGTFIEHPVIFKCSYSVNFLVGDIDPLKTTNKEPQIEPNINFEPDPQFTTQEDQPF
jgi:hypothetical protein